MPTTEPLDDVGDDAGGPLKPIAEFAEAAKTATPVGASPRAAVPTAQAQAPAAAVAASTADRPRPGEVARPEFSTSTNHHKKTINIPDVRLSGQRPAPKTSQTTAPQSSVRTSAVPLAEPYTDADLLAAWKRFIADNSSEKLLTNAMNAAKPTRQAGDTFRVAHSEVHIGLIHDNLARIRTYIQNALRNSNIDFVFEVVSEDSPLAWNDHELIRHMVEQNPALGKFISELKLSLI